MLGSDDVIVLEKPTLKALSIDRYDRLGDCAHNCATLSVKSVEMANFKNYRRVSVYVEDLQHRTLQAEPDDDDFEHLISRGSDIFMTLQEEEARACGSVVFCCAGGSSRRSTGQP